MRISDDRYSRDVRKYNLAMRLIHHEARTGTIRNWTGLSRRSIRNLFRSYVHNEADGRAARHRGPSPHMVELLLQSPQMRADVALLASLLCLLDLIPLRPVPIARRELPNIVRGEQLCTAFELFREFMPGSNITLEHALLLVATLIQRKELELAKCASCGALIVIDFHGESGPVCGLCLGAGHSGATKRVARLMRRRARFVQRPIAPVSPNESYRLTVGKNSNDSVVQHQDGRATDRNA